VVGSGGALVMVEDFREDSSKGQSVRTQLGDGEERLKVGLQNGEVSVRDRSLWKGGGQTLR